MKRAMGIITANGCNITALTVAPDAVNPGLACATLVADVEPQLHTRAVNELNRLVQLVRAW